MPEPHQEKMGIGHVHAAEYTNPCGRVVFRLEKTRRSLFTAANRAAQTGCSPSQSDDEPDAQARRPSSPRADAVLD